VCNGLRLEAQVLLHDAQIQERLRHRAHRQRLEELHPRAFVVATLRQRRALRVFRLRRVIRLRGRGVDRDRQREQDRDASKKTCGAHGPSQK
jgi:hypothetical protein